MKVVREYELGNKSPTFWITNHRLAMQDLQVAIEYSESTTKQLISSSIRELTESSATCEDIIRQTYGSYRSLENTITVYGEKIITILKNTKNPDDLKTNEELNDFYSEVIDEIKGEIKSILEETDKALNCLENLKNLNLNVYRYIIQEDKILESSLYEVQNRWLTFFGANKKVIKDIKKQLELIAKLNIERKDHNQEIYVARGNLKELQSYLEKTSVKLNREKYSMEYLNYQLSAIRQSLTDMKNPKIENETKEAIIKAAMIERNEL